MVKNGVLCVQALFRAKMLRKARQEAWQLVLEKRAQHAVRVLQMWLRGKIAIFHARAALLAMKVREDNLTIGGHTY